MIDLTDETNDAFDWVSHIPDRSIQRKATRLRDRVAASANRSSHIRMLAVEARAPDPLQPLRLHVTLASIAGRIPCMSLTFYRYPRFVRATLETLKLDAHERACPVAGVTLLDWVKRLVTDGIVRQVDLTDASTWTVPGTTTAIRLTRFRKFTKGEGYYERHGFRCRDSHVDRVYHTSMYRVRMASRDNVVRFVWQILRHFTRRTRGGRVVLDGSTPVVTSQVPVDDLRQLHAARSRLNPVIPWAFNVEGLRQSIVLCRAHVTEAARFLRRAAGMQVSVSCLREMLEAPHSPDQLRWLRRVMGSPSKGCACFMRAVAPPSMRRTMERILQLDGRATSDSQASELGDVRRYVSGLNAVLELLETFDLVVTPRELVYRHEPRRTPAKSFKTCHEVSC